MPYPNEHACRRLEPEQFVRFFRKHAKDEEPVEGHEPTGKAYDLIVGHREDGTSDVQAFRYSKDSWAEAEARRHCKAHGGKDFEPASEGESDSVQAWDAPLPSRESERRAFGLREMRVAQDDGGPPRIVGYAAVFNALSENLGGFRERIAPGAFEKTLREGDIRSVWNHNPDYVLGRTKVDTLRLKEDEHGLAIEIFPPDTQWARDLMVTIGRGDVDQMSFSFSTIRDEWGTRDGQTERTLMEVKLFEVSPVTFPAYPQTSVQVRSALGMDLGEVEAAMGRLEAGTATPSDRALLERLVRQTETCLAATPGLEPHLAEEVDGEQLAQARHAIRRRRLEHELKR